MIVSSEQQRDSARHIQAFNLPQTPLPSRLPQSRVPCAIQKVFVGYPFYFILFLFYFTILYWFCHTSTCILLLVFISYFILLLFLENFQGGKLSSIYLHVCKPHLIINLRHATLGTSLVVLWLRIHVVLQGMWV